MKHHIQTDVSDKIALGFTKALRFVADTFFKKITKKYKGTI
mgnify:CR=1 FL=1